MHLAGSSSSSYSASSRLNERLSLVGAVQRVQRGARHAGRLSSERGVGISRPGPHAKPFEARHHGGLSAPRLRQYAASLTSFTADDRSKPDRGVHCRSWHELAALHGLEHAQQRTDLVVDLGLDRRAWPRPGAAASRHPRHEAACPADELAQQMAAGRLAHRSRDFTTSFPVGIAVAATRRSICARAPGWPSDFSADASPARGLDRRGNDRSVHQASRAVLHCLCGHG